jgi:HK97 gp10 family phage protein
MADQDAFKALEALSAAVQSTGLQSAALAGAKPISNGWKDGIQKWPLIKTGTYRRSIHEQVFAAESAPAQVVVAIGTDIVDPPYPMFLEYGTSKMPAKPVGRTALEENKEAAQREFGAAIWDVIRGAVG